MTRLHRTLRWLWPLLAMAGTVFAVWLVFETHNYGRTGDAWLLLGVGLVYLIAVGFILTYTRRWDWRALGQIVTYLADAGLYIGAGGSALGVRPAIQGWELNLIRAMFVCGGVALTGGLLAWVLRTHGGKKPNGIHEDAAAHD